MSKSHEDLDILSRTNGIGCTYLVTFSKGDTAAMDRYGVYLAPDGPAELSSLRALDFYTDFMGAYVRVGLEVRNELALENHAANLFDR